MHILVAEDQQYSARNIKRHLETESCGVDFAFGGEAGLPILMLIARNGHQNAVGRGR